MSLILRTPRSNTIFTGCSKQSDFRFLCLRAESCSRPNIELHSFSQSPIEVSNRHTPWIPPHPQRGTPYHRYVIMLVPQADPRQPLDIPVVSDQARLGFNYRAFAAQHGLDATKGGGIFMFREVWDETVSKIYSDVLSTSSLYAVTYVYQRRPFLQKLRSPDTAGYPRRTRMPQSRRRKSMPSCSNLLSRRNSARVYVLHLLNVMGSRGTWS